MASTGLTPEMLTAVLLYGLLGYSWMAAVVPRLRLTGAGLWLRGPLRDEFVPWSRVERVLADERGLVVRLVDGAAVLGVPKAHVAWLLPGVDDPLEAARLCEDARLRSGIPTTSGPVPGGPRRPHGLRLVSPQVLCGAAWSLAGIAGLAVWIH
jgi:hypothetical protein